MSRKKEERIKGIGSGRGREGRTVNARYWIATT